MEIHRLNPVAFSEHSPRPSSDPVEGLFKVVQKKTETISKDFSRKMHRHSGALPKTGERIPLNLFGASVRRKRESETQTADNPSQLLRSTLLKYQWINERIHHAMPNNVEEAFELHRSIMPPLFDQKSLIAFVVDQIQKKPKILNHELRAIIDHKIDKRSNGRFLLDANARFLIYEGVYLILPGLYLKNNTFPILSSTWAHLHAGSTYCLHSHLDPLKFSEEGIRLTGSLLATLAHQKDNGSIIPYFQVPAILYYLLTHPNLDHFDASFENLISLKEAYLEYFKTLMDMQRVEEDIILNANHFFKQECKPRKELVKEILTQGGIDPSDSDVNQYIYTSNYPLLSKIESAVITNLFNKGSMETQDKIDRFAQTRDPIDIEYEKQNANFVKHYIALEREIVKRFFVSMQPEDKVFIAKGTVYFLDPVFRDTEIALMHSVHKTPILALKSPDKTVHLSQRLDLRFFSATTPDATRLYLLKSIDVFNYSLSRLGEEKESYEPFLPNEKKEYPHFQFSIYKDGKIKDAHQSIETFFNQIASKHEQNYKDLLFQQGYNETTSEKVTNVALGFIPFYDFIQSIKKGMYGHAINYLILDLFGCAPLFGVGVKFTTQCIQKVKSALTKTIAQQTTEMGLLRAVRQRLLVDFDHFPIKSLSIQTLKATAHSIDPGLYPLYLISRLNFKGTDVLLKHLLTFASNIKQARLIEPEALFNTIVQQLTNPAFWIDFSNIQKRVTERKKEVVVIELKNVDGTIDYIRIDPNTHVLFGNKYTTGKNHTLIDKLPIEMFHKGEAFVPDSDIEKTTENIDKEIDAGCAVSKSYLGDKRYESLCQIKKPFDQERPCTIEALQVEEALVSAQLKSLEKIISQLAQKLSQLDHKTSEYQQVEEAYFSQRIEALMMERRRQTYPMLIETFSQPPTSQRPSTQQETEWSRTCKVTEQTKHILENLHKEIDAGCFVSIDEDRKKRYLSPCHIQEPRAKEIFYTIAALQIKSAHISKELQSLEEKQNQFAKQLSNLEPRGSNDSHLEEGSFSLKIDHLILQRRKETYPMLIERLTESAIYKMPLAKDLFSSYRATSKKLYIRYLNHPTLFEMRDEEGNGILHYLGVTTDPKTISFFFRYLSHHTRGLKEAVIDLNRRGETPIIGLMRNRALGNYRQGYQGMFGQLATRFNIASNPMESNTLLDQILTFFEKNLEASQLDFESLYAIFKEAANMCNLALKPPIHQMLSDCGKVESWVRKNLSTQVNAIHPESRQTLFHQAIKRGDATLAYYLTFYTNLYLEELDYEALYDIFDFICKHFNDEHSIKMWAEARFLSKIDVTDPKNGETLLHQAVRSRNAQLVVYLINLGANTEIQNHANHTSDVYLQAEDLDGLYAMFQYNDAYGGSRFKQWVRSHLVNRINTRDSKNGDTMLHKAARERNIRLITSLIDLGASTELKNHSGQTPASQIIQDSNLDLFYKIFDCASTHKNSTFEQWVKKDLLGTTNMTHGENGETVFHQATKKKNLRLITDLIDLGANSEQKNGDQRTPTFYIKTHFDLLYAMFHQASQMEGSQFEKWVRVHLLDQINLPNGPLDRTLLYHACSHRHISCIFYLINLGADSEIQDFDHTTSVSYVKTHFDLLYQILSQASQSQGSTFETWVKAHFLDQINASLGSSGQTLLHQAVINKETPLITYLHNHGAREDIEEDFGKITRPLETESEEMIPRQRSQRSPNGRKESQSSRQLESKKPPTPSLELQTTPTQIHAIKKRSLDLQEFSNNQATLIENAMTHNAPLISPLSKVDRSNLLRSQEIFSLSHIALLLKRTFFKTKKRAQHHRWIQETNKKKIFCGKRLDEIEASLSDEAHLDPKDKKMHRQLKEEWKCLKERFKEMLENDETTIETLTTLERQIQTLQRRLQLIQDFYAFIETIADNS